MSETALSTSTKISDSLRGGEAHAKLQLQCPVCGQKVYLFDFRDMAAWNCPKCGFVLSEMDGIFRCLTQEREQHFRQFIREYELVRAKEGRGCSSGEYYLQLPFKDLTGHNHWQWQIRARTWRHMERYLLPNIERSYPQGCDVLDIGAGNCWLSYRIALRGHRPVAVDLLDNNADGLGAGRHYLSSRSQPFLRFQAEMDHLPFASQQFDLAIFNASFHYSVNYEQTLTEVLRSLRRPGRVIIADSPFYSCDEYGRKMVAEKHVDFERRFGFRSDSIPSREYLTPVILNELAEKLRLCWRVLKPWYGINWALRPVKARLLRRRQPAKFYLLWAKVDA
jgi:ubiquinone/menaquinone biosynthesis C-methylase UbiE